MAALPLKAMEVHGRIDGLLAQVSVRQTFVNRYEVPLEATYIVPLPDRAAVTRFRMEVGGRVVEGELQERGQARREYRQAIEAGHRASIAEEERPGVFTIRVGNLPPGESAVVELSMTGPLPFADGEVTFRFPLVVAPRYIPGSPLPGPSAGDGVAVDTDAVPDASRISPPVLLPGFPNPVRLALTIDVHESVAAVGVLRSSLHAVVERGEPGYRRVSLRPGERLNRDFVLRFRLGTESIGTSLSVHPDTGRNGEGGGDAHEGTFALTVVPPGGSARATRPRDLVFVLDRSGSMEGWKMVAARRALARMVDTLGAEDRFNVIAFDDRTESPSSFSAQALVAASDRQRFRAVEFLATLEARGGTEMAQPLEQAVEILSREKTGRDRLLVLVTDGQVGNEGQILSRLGKRVQGIRVFTLGIDRAVNEGFLRRLAELGGGSCEVVESEDRLDEVMDAVHRRIGTPVLTELRVDQAGLSLIPDTLVPDRVPDLFASAPVLILGRYRGAFPGSLKLSGRDAAGADWTQDVAAAVRENPAIAAAWARGQVRKLEDRYTIGSHDRNAVEQAIVATSLRFGVLCRFTAYVAIDRAEVVNREGQVHKVTQPVELPDGWAMQDATGSFGAASAIPAGPPAAAPNRAKRAIRAARSVPDPDDRCMSPPSQAEERLAPPPAASSFLPPGHSFDGIDEDFSETAMEFLNPCEMPQDLGTPVEPRQLALELELELATAIEQGGKALLKALRAMISRLETLAIALSTIGGTDPGRHELELVLKDLRRVLGKTWPTAAAARPVALRAQAILAAIAGLPTTEGTPGPTEAERKPFWK